MCVSVKSFIMRKELIKWQFSRNLWKLIYCDTNTHTHTHCCRPKTLKLNPSSWAWVHLLVWVDHSSSWFSCSVCHSLELCQISAGLLWISFLYKNVFCITLLVLIDRLMMSPFPTVHWDLPWRVAVFAETLKKINVLHF